MGTALELESYSIVARRRTRPVQIVKGLKETLPEERGIEEGQTQRYLPGPDVSSDVLLELQKITTEILVLGNTGIATQKNI